MFFSKTKNPPFDKLRTDFFIPLTCFAKLLTAVSSFAKSGYYENFNFGYLCQDGSRRDKKAQSLKFDS